MRPKEHRINNQVNKFERVKLNLQFSNKVELTKTLSAR